jgi:hypothetical protein
MQVAPGVEQAIGEHGTNGSPHHRRYYAAGLSFLGEGDFGAASGIDLLPVRGLFGLFSLHLPEFATT